MRYYAKGTIVFNEKSEVLCAVDPLFWTSREVAYEAAKYIAEQMGKFDVVDAALKGVVD